MKKIAMFTLVLSLFLSVLGLSGCTPGNNVPGATVAGAAAGGLIGGALFDGQPGGVIAGALLGGIVGNQIGQQMDQQDRINMLHAIAQTPINREAVWTNNKTNVTYVVRPISQYHRGHLHCREYQTSIHIEGHGQKKAYGKACKRPGEEWHIVS